MFVDREDGENILNRVVDGADKSKYRLLGGRNDSFEI